MATQGDIGGGAGRNGEEHRATRGEGLGPTQPGQREEQHPEGGAQDPRQVPVGAGHGADVAGAQGSQGHEEDDGVPAHRTSLPQTTGLDLRP